MKIQILSDLHNEFWGGQVPTIEQTDADVIVMAGDIDVGMRGVHWASAEAVRLGKPVIYVAGNHEYYRCEAASTLQQMREAAGLGVHFLERDAVVIGGVRFLGCTLWTDFAVAGDVERALDEAQHAMNDYLLVRVPANGRVSQQGTPLDPHGNYRLLKAADTLAWHRESVGWLKACLEEPFDGQTVVVTHHGPSPICQHPKFRLSPITASFLSDLDELLGPPVALWVFGHTHASLDVAHRGTRIVANQRGYPKEAGFIPGGFDPRKIVCV